MVISIAPQNGIPAASLAKSIGRVPASPIAAALDLVSSFERERAE